MSNLTSGANNYDPGPASGPGLPVHRGRAGLLRDHVPARARAGERGIEPLLLRSAEHGALRISELRALRGIDRIRAAATRARAGFVRAVLPVVEHEEVGEAAEARARVDARVRAERHHGARHRHVLVPRLVRRRAAR